MPASERSDQNIAEPGRRGEAPRSPSAFVAEREIACSDGSWRADRQRLAIGRPLHHKRAEA